MLVVDSKYRLTAKAALNMSWIQNYKQRLEPVDLSVTLEKLQEFQSSVKLKDAVHVYLATQKMTREDQRGLKEQF